MVLLRKTIAVENDQTLSDPKPGSEREVSSELKSERLCQNRRRFSNDMRVKTTKDVSPLNRDNFRQEKAPSSSTTGTTGPLDLIKMPTFFLSVF